LIAAVADQCTIRRDYVKYCQAFAKPRPGYAHDSAGPGRGRRSDAWLDNKIAALFVWLFQNLFHTRARWTKCSAPEKQKPRVCGAFVRALFRTRTGDPLLTMEVLYQLS
jgi:hypothetical protein